MTTGEYIAKKLVEWNNYKSDANCIECSDFESLLTKIKEYYNKEETTQRKEIIKYEISGDGVGLLAYWEDGGFYHIHSNELTKLEKWIFNMLKENNEI